MKAISTCNLVFKVHAMYQLPRQTAPRVWVADFFRLAAAARSRFLINIAPNCVEDAVCENVPQFACSERIATTGVRPATIALQSQQTAVAFWRLRPIVYGPQRACPRWSECANDIMHAALWE
jgi:hypothetical protein